MFGFLRLKGCALSEQDRLIYGSHFCSACHAMAGFGGIRSSLLTNYDITFWLLLCSALGEGEPLQVERRPCTALPWRDVTVRPLPPRVQRSMAALNLLLVSSKVEDEASDNPGWKPRLARALYGERFAKAAAALGEEGFPLESLSGLQQRQQRAEQSSAPTLDSLADPTESTLADVFAHIARLLERSHLAEPLAQVGRCLGGYLYLWDALVDLSEDRRRNQFNAIERVCGGRLDDPRLAAALRGRLEGLKEALSDLALGPEGALCFSLHASLLSRLQEKLPARRPAVLPNPRHRLAQAGILRAQNGDCCEIDCCECGSCCDCNLCDCGGPDKHCCELNCCGGSNCCCCGDSAGGSSSCCSSRPSDQATCCCFDGLTICCFDHDLCEQDEVGKRRSSGQGFWTRMRQARKHRRMEVEVNERTRRSCPACERPMVVLLVGEVEVDECRNCGGIWLDDKELESLARLTSLPNNLLNRYPTQEHPTRHLPGERPCPACRDEAKLVGVPYLDVPVEMCKKCFGFWLEHGRLGKVLRAKRSPMQLLKGHRSEWRCPYCQSVAGAGRDVCDKCGAPRPSTGFTGKLG